MAKTFDEYKQAIEKSIDELPEIVGDIEVLAAQDAHVQLLLRTFATGGSGVKTITGQNLSKYSDQYAKKRLKAGRQTANKDLIFSNDTSAIKDNIMVGISGGKPAMGHLNERGYLIATYQEEREGEKIFALNDSEIAAVAETIKTHVMNSISEMVSKWKE